MLRPRRAEKPPHLLKFLLSLFILLPGDPGTTTQGSSHYWPPPDGLKEEAFGREQDSGNTRHFPHKPFLPALPPFQRHPARHTNHPTSRGPEHQVGSPNLAQQLQDRRAQPSHPAWHLSDSKMAAPQAQSQHRQTKQTNTEYSAQNPRKEAGFPHCQHMCAAGSPHKGRTSEK